MKFTAERPDLLRSLSLVHRVAGRNSSVAILNNVLVRAERGRLALKASDLDLEMTYDIQVETTEDGATTVSAQVLHDIVRRLPEAAQVMIDAPPDMPMSIRAGRSRFTLPTLPASIFPDLTVGDLTHRFEISSADLRSLIDKTQFAISTEETRYYLNGLGLQIKDVLRAAATDGHRLAQFELPTPAGAEGAPDVIVPRKTVGEMRRLIDDVSGDVVVELSGTKVRVAVDGVVLTSKLIDGTFPNYRAVIPLGNDVRLEVSKYEFARAVERVSVVIGEQGHSVKLSLSPDQLVISAESMDSTSATEELDVNYDAEELDVRFSYRYLLDMVDHLDGDTAVLMLGGPTTPALLTDKDDDRTTYVLMPMRK